MRCITVAILTVRENFMVARTRLVAAERVMYAPVDASGAATSLDSPGELPDDELSDAVEYDDGSDERFLRRLWRDLYGDEPV
jgi:hypothetical protein